MKKVLFLVLLIIFASCSTNGNTTYRIGFDPEFSDVDLSNKETNARAFTIELITKIGMKEKLNLSLVEVNPGELQRGLDQNVYQAMISSMTPRLFHMNQFLFSEPFLRTGPVLILPIGSKFSSFENLAVKEIATLRGSDAVMFLEHFPDLIIRTYDLIPDAFNALLAGHVDGAAIDALPAYDFTRMLYRDYLQVVTSPLNDDGLRFVGTVEEGEFLIKHLNSGLKKLQKDGTYDELLKKWSLKN